MFAFERVDPRLRREDILGILRRSFGPRVERRFAWSYLDGPFGPARSWMAIDTATGAAVGVVAVFPRRARLGGREALAGVAGDFAVDPAHRGFGPGLRLQKIARADLRAAGLDFVYSVPNERSEAVLLRAGFEAVAPLRRHVRVLRSEVRTDRFLPPSSLTRRLRFLVDPLLGLTARPLSFGGRPAYAVKSPAELDVRFERLWRKAAAGFPVAGVRTAEFLRWRYACFPNRSFHTLALESGGELKAGLVFAEKETSAEVVDLLFLPGWGETLLGELARLAWRRGYGSIVMAYLGRPEVERALARALFLRAGESRTLLVACADPADRPVLLRPSSWHFVMGDNDV